jgi:hypothetical protein
MVANTHQQLVRMIPALQHKPFYEGVLEHIKKQELTIRNLEESIEIDSKFYPIILRLREILEQEPESIPQVIHQLCSDWEGFKREHLF